MRLCTFVADDGKRAGVIEGDRVLDVGEDLLTLVGEGVEAIARRRDAATRTHPVAEVRLLAPLPRPGKFLHLGLNYADHAVETHLEVPRAPVLFPKWANSVIGTGEAIVIPEGMVQVDYEAELAFVVGRRLRHVSGDEALAGVFGYTAVDDVSERHYQFLTSQWTAGKAIDTFGPMGPVLVTPDELEDPDAVPVRCYVNGELVQDGNTRNLIFPVERILAFVTRFMTLEPGDVISTGTPTGVQHGRANPRWLVPGDVVRVEIPGIGALENPVTAERGDG